jgi:hypothetical protein
MTFPTRFKDRQNGGAKITRTTLRQSPEPR